VAADVPLKDQPHLRRPVASAWIEEGKLLAVANRCGSVSIVDVPSQKAIEEIQIGERLADIAAHPKGRWLLTVDEQKHELIVLKRRRNSLEVAARHAVSPYPVSVAISPDGQRVSVASLWSRKVTIFEPVSGKASSGATIKQLAALPVPFNPRHQFLGRDKEANLVEVHDAFADRTAVIDARGARLVGEIKPLVFPIDLEVSAGMLLPDVVPHAAKELVASAVRSYAAYVPRGGESVVDGTEFYSRDGAELKLGRASAVTPADRGEQLFYRNGSWSSQLWMTCNSCHVDGHTSYGLADTLGDDTTGTPKRIPTLMGTRLTDPWAWNGKMRDLNEQVRKSLETTMHVHNATAQEVNDITAFLHTLPPPPPLEPVTDDPKDKAQLARGEGLFKSLGCVTCHVPPLTYTSPGTYDVGLRDEKGLDKFNPPSLRGVSQGYAFFHDGRAKKLEEVFTVHGHQLNRGLEDEELADLLRFLRSL
jgi:cytochrome c peroxidase